jgi:rhodanese-related sulfurtransferase
MKRLILIPLLFLWARAAVAASPVIVDGHHVADAIARNAVVWDVRAADAYAQGHIAGAISIGDAAKVLRDDNTEDFIATDRIEKILGAAGLDSTREIIVYGTRGTWNPYFGLYTLQKCARRLHRSLPSNGGKTSADRKRMGARAQARRLPAANSRSGRPGAALHYERC